MTGVHPLHDDPFAVGDSGDKRPGVGAHMAEGVKSGIQKVVQGPIGRKLTGKYQAQIGIVKPDDFHGGGDVHAGFSRDDAQWAWWKRYAEVMSN